MKILSLSAGGPSRSSYLRIAGGVRAAIQAGQLKSGEPLPSTRELARSFRVHRHTVMAGLDELVAEGWLKSFPRSGYRVHQTLPSRFFTPAAGSRSAARRPHVWKTARATDPAASWKAAAQVPYAFKSGLADLRAFPQRELRSMISDSFRLSRARVLDYGDPKGYPALIDAVGEYLRRMRAISGREIIITHGSQEALFLAAQVLVAPASAVAVERLGYPPAWEALRAAGGKLVGVDVDEEGVVPESLERALKGGAKLIYLTPLHQFPTTATLPAARRLRVYELASRFGAAIIEDDYDHEFHYRSQPSAPLASADPEGRVIYVSTFSKVLFPSARIGFMAVPAALAKPLIDYRRIVSRQNETLLQDAVARWMRSGGFERHLRRARRTYEERRDVLLECLSHARAGGLPLSWADPDGGMAVWVDVGADADKVAREALSRGVLIQVESSYRLDKGRGTHLRLGFANQNPDEIRQGMKRLMAAIAAARR